LLCLSSCFFLVNDTPTTEIYTLSLHDALPISGAGEGQSQGRNMKGRAVAVVLAAVLCMGIAMAAPAAADVNDVSGSGAFGESVKVTVAGSGSVTSGPMPTVTLPSGGGGPFTDSLANVSLKGILTSGVLNVSTEGTNLGSRGGTAKSSASVAEATAGEALSNQLEGKPLLKAELISSQCTSNGDGSSGSSNLVDLEIAGNGQPVSPPPNTTIDVIPGALSVTLNEQIVNNSPGETSITVNAVHVRLNVGDVATGDIILSQSRCRAAGPDVLGGPGGGGPGGPEAATAVTANPKFTG